MSIFINLAVIFWSLFPSLLVYTDNQNEPLKVQLTQLVANSDLLIDDNSDGTPDGFQYVNATDISLTNGIAKFTATAKNGYFSKSNTNNYIIGNKYYHYARVKASNSNVRLYVDYPGASYYHSGSGTFEHLSLITELTAIRDNLYIMDNNVSNWTPIEVDYIGAINITDLVSKGCLPAGLTDNEYKTLIDNILAEIGGTFQGDYFYSEGLTDNYKWFSTGFVEKTGERDFLDYLGFFVWFSFPYLFAFALYKLLKGVIYG